MNTNEEQEIRKEFQLERVVLFSDAVFAIIITIMVLELRLPEGLRHASLERVKEALMELLPKFGGYILSFFLVGMFWTKHLKIFSYLKDYTKALIVYNLLFLFAISLFPFAVTLMTETVGPHNLYGLIIYFSIVMLSSLTQTLLVGYLVNNAQQLCYKPDEIGHNLQWKSQRLNYIAIPTLYAFLITCILLELGPNAITVACMIWAIVIVVIRKRYYPTPPSEGGPILARLFRSRKVRG